MPRIASRKDNFVRRLSFFPSGHDLQSTTRLAESWMLQIMDTRMGLFFSHNFYFSSKARCYRRFSCTKHNVIALLSMVMPCYWQRHYVVIYLARKVRHIRVRQHFPRHPIIPTDLSPMEENFVRRLSFCPSVRLSVCATYSG